MFKLMSKEIIMILSSKNCLSGFKLCCLQTTGFFSRCTTLAFSLSRIIWLRISLIHAGFYIKLNVWGSLGLNFEYDGGPIIEIGGPIFLYKLRILEGSTFFPEGLV